MFDLIKNAVRGAIAERKEAQETLPVAIGPLGLKIGGMVKIDSIPFRMLPEGTLFQSPEGDQQIVTRGEIDLGALAKIHRFYLTDDAFIQINTTADVIDDLKLFVFHETLHPASQQELDRWGGSSGSIGKLTMDVDGTLYNRVWGDEATLQAPPIHFVEQVASAKSPDDDYDCKHYCMLYQRELPNSERREYLLISAEETDEGVCVVKSVGVDITTADLTIY